MAFRNQINSTAHPLIVLLALALETSCSSSSSPPPEYGDCLVLDGVPIECSGSSWTDGGIGGSGALTPDAGAPAINNGVSDTTRQPFTKPFTALISQPVPFSVDVVKILAARLSRGQDPARLPGQTYAELDLSILNLSTSDLDYSDRDTWDLELADGTRIPSDNPVGVVVAAGCTAKTTLRYPVSDGATLAGSKLILDGDQRGTAEPEPVPLDAKWTSPYPVEVHSLEGKTAISSDHLYELDIVGAAVELNDIDVYRALLGEKFIRLDVIGHNNGTLASVGEDAFRAIANGLSTAPVNSVYQSLDSNTSRKFSVVFDVDKSIQAFDIRLSWQGVNATYHVDLSQNGAAPAPDGGVVAHADTP